VMIDFKTDVEFTVLMLDLQFEKWKEQYIAP